jgi:hypothetical protein
MPTHTRAHIHTHTYTHTHTRTQRPRAPPHSRTVAPWLPRTAALMPQAASTGSICLPFVTTDIAETRHDAIVMRKKYCWRPSPAPRAAAARHITPEGLSTSPLKKTSGFSALNDLTCDYACSVNPPLRVQTGMRRNNVPGSRTCTHDMSKKRILQQLARPVPRSPADRLLPPALNIVHVVEMNNKQLGGRRTCHAQRHTHRKQWHRNPPRRHREKNPKSRVQPRGAHTPTCVLHGGHTSASPTTGCVGNWFWRNRGTTSSRTAAGHL